MRMSATMVSPMRYEPIDEKSVRSTSPKSSPTAPPKGMAPNAVTLGKATSVSAARMKTTTISPAIRVTPAREGLPLSRGAASRASSTGKNHAAWPIASMPARATKAPTGPTQSAPVISGRSGSPRKDASASALKRAVASSTSAAASRAYPWARRGTPTIGRSRTVGAGTSPGPPAGWARRGAKSGTGIVYLVLPTPTAFCRASPGSLGGDPSFWRWVAQVCRIAAPRNRRKNFELRRCWALPSHPRSQGHAWQGLIESR